MKILIIGLGDISLQTVLSDERLAHFHRLMEMGCFGAVEIPPATSIGQAWSCFVTGRNPESFQPSHTAPLAQGTLWDAVICEGKRAILIGSFPVAVAETHGLTIRSFEPGIADCVASEKQFDQVRSALQTGEWDCVQLGIAVHHDLSCWDAQLGKTLEALTDDSVVLMLALSDTNAGEAGAENGAPTTVPDGFFVLAAPYSPLSGDVGQVSLQDLAPTLLELGGYGVPPSMQGKSLASGKAFAASSQADLTAEDEQTLLERLGALGYIA